MSDTLKIANSIWPNGMKVDSDGHAIFYPLGTNKVKVPTSSSEWPKGNKLVSPFVYDKDDKLVGFVDTKALKAFKNTTIYLPYEHIEAEFSAINKGKLQIHAPKAITKKVSWKDSGVEDIPEVQFKYKGCYTLNDVKEKNWNYDYLADVANGTWSEPLWDLTSDVKYMFNQYNDLYTFESDLPNLTDGSYMFQYCRNLASFNGDLSNLTENTEMFFFTNLQSWNIDLPNLRETSAMFSGCENLSSFKSDLSNLTKGNSMFSGCENLSSFESDLPNLTEAGSMFFRCKFTKFDINLPNLTYGFDMFQDCYNLTTFSSDLSSLTNGNGMFSSCTNLTSFSSDLSSLTNGYYMFKNCSKLESFNSDLSNLRDGQNMFYGCPLNTASVQNIADTINTYSGRLDIGIGNSEPNEQETEAFNKIASKGWIVYVNGSRYMEKPSPVSDPTNIDGEETGTPIPFYAKPVQSDEEHAKYVDGQGNFFNILGGQFIYGDDLSTYGMFTCEEDAAANMRLTPYIKPIEN